MFGDILGFAGDLLGIKSQESANDQNIKMQREFAQKGIRWKVSDAKKAGIHPLYALGASTHMPTASIKGSQDAIRSAGDRLGNIADGHTRRIKGLTEKNLEADIALKMARASEVAKRAQKLNSQQDFDLLSAEKLDNPKPRMKLHKKRQPIDTVIGRLLPDTKPGYIDADRIPDRYGDEAKDVLGLVALWNDYWRDSGHSLANTTAGKAIHNFKIWLSKDKRNKRKPKVITPYMR
jgi:hypothetical protein